MSSIGEYLPWNQTRKWNCERHIRTETDKSCARFQSTGRGLRLTGRCEKRYNPGANQNGRLRGGGDLQRTSQGALPASKAANRDSKQQRAVIAEESRGATLGDLNKMCGKTLLRVKSQWSAFVESLPQGNCCCGPPRDERRRGQGISSRRTRRRVPHPRCENTEQAEWDILWGRCLRCCMLSSRATVLSAHSNQHTQCRIWLCIPVVYTLPQAVTDRKTEN